MHSLFPYTPEENCKVSSVAAMASPLLDGTQLDLLVTSLNVWGTALWEPCKS